MRRAITLIKSEPSLSSLTRARIMREIPSDDPSERIASFVVKLLTAGRAMSPQTVAFGLECALESIQRDLATQKVELVWTGPESSAVSMRRSAAVLLELIEGARSDLFVVSFASFGIADVHAALRRAAERGVRVSLILESEKDSDGRYSNHGVTAFADLAAANLVQFYRWPRENRPHRAVLHAKAAVADGSTALVTSANLTDYAVEANIEIGVLVKGGSVPGRLREHLLSLVECETFVKVASGAALSSRRRRNPSHRARLPESWS